MYAGWVPGPDDNGEGVILLGSGVSVGSPSSGRWVELRDDTASLSSERQVVGELDSARPFISIVAALSK